MLFSLSGCYRYHKPDHRSHWIKQRIAGKLDLTDAQQAKLDEIWSEFATRHDEIRGMRDTTKAEMSALIRRPELDVEAMKGMIQDKTARFNELAGLFVERLAELHATLTTEQREKLAALIEDHPRDRFCRFRKHP